MLYVSLARASRLNRPVCEGASGNRSGFLVCRDQFRNRSYFSCLFFSRRHRHQLKEVELARLRLRPFRQLWQEQALFHQVRLIIARATKPLGDVFYHRDILLLNFMRT